jgi:hypothetical protein
MDLNHGELQQRAEADRREADPPIEVETATWAQAGQLDWWVKDRQERWGQGTRCRRPLTVDQSC